MVELGLTVIVPIRLLRLARIGMARLNGQITAEEYVHLMGLEKWLLAEPVVEHVDGGNDRAWIFGATWHMNLRKGDPNG